MYEGSTLTFTTIEGGKDQQTPEKIWISYPSLFDSVDVGNKILLDDGAVEVEVAEKDASTGEIKGLVLNNGRLGNRKGVNLPGQRFSLSIDMINCFAHEPHFTSFLLGVKMLDLPAMCEKDKLDIKWGVENDIDFIAASFTRKAADIREIREYVASLMPLYQKPGHPHPLIISKIENTEALTNFDEILAESDAIMVARG